MEATDLEWTMEALKAMSDLELAVADFYQNCSEIREKEEDFWISLKQDEERHAQSLQNLSQIVSERQSFFAANRSFNVTAVHTLKNSVNKSIKRLQNHQISLDFINLLSIAWNIEYTISEIKYNQIFLISEQEFENQLQRILSETALHRSRLGSKIAAMRNWSPKSHSRAALKGPNETRKRFALKKLPERS